MDELLTFRQKINDTDATLLAAFEERMRISREIGALKSREGMPVRHPERERDVIESRVSSLRDPSLADAAERLFRLLIDLSCETQEQVIRAGDDTAETTGNGEV
ncbi:chorismate mutase [Oscillospiraceae bacterium OttesenSCG-928-G22]|nr:chorismate mutase [Oscillospiraceae bacterium OttesenSCG-928-G22]